MNIDAPQISFLGGLRALWKEAFGDTEKFLDSFYSTAFCADRCRCVTLDGKISAALYWFDCVYDEKPIAYLYAVATAKEYRGQGICRKLMENTHCHLKELGYAGTILVPGSKELFTLYRGMGYQTCSHIGKLHCDAAELKTELSLIDKFEYAKLRRQFLPEKGVIQEQENLDFLQTQAKFYKGPHFLLAARGNMDTLHGIELLGDKAAASQIVNTLGYKKGVFRVAQNDIPFAMYLALDKGSLTPPAYFGLAFD